MLDVIPCGAKDVGPCGGVDTYGTACYGCPYYDAGLDGRLGPEG